MKKIFVLAMIVFLVYSCGTPKTVIESRKVIKGDWIIDNIAYSEEGTYNITLFKDTSKECFEGSTWKFVPNNNRGVYTIKDDGNCPSGDRNYIFDIQEMDPNTGLYDFLLKPTDKKYKSPDNTGFRLRLSQLGENSMQWTQTVSLEGKPFTIYMNFSRN